jgi:hypothetical protein
MRLIILALISLVAAPASAGTVADARWLCAHLPGKYTASEIAWAKTLVPDCGPASGAAPAVALPVPKPATGVRITSTAGLLTMLANAKGGETFEVADGRYDIRVSNKAWPSPVTLFGSRAVRASPFAEISNVKGLIVRGITFTGKAAMAEGTYGLLITGSDGVTLDSIGVIGADRSGAGIFLRSAGNRNITIRNAELARWQTAIRASGVENLRIEKPNIYDLASDGVQLSGTVGAVIQDGHWHDFTPGPNQHPDGIQFVGANRNARVLRNTMRIMGQGIFSDGKGFQDNLSVIGNDISVGYSRALSVPNSSGTVQQNIVTRAGPTPVIELGGMKSDRSNRIDGKAR